MWTCPNCDRIFEKEKQPHSCHKIPLDEHFKNKEEAKKLFNFLIKTINENIGKCKVISIPCCIHLFGKYDFLAILPKKDKLEIRFALNQELKSTRVKQCVLMSKNIYKNCIDIHSKKEIDRDLIDWLNQSFRLKDNTS